MSPTTNNSKAPVEPSKPPTNEGPSGAELMAAHIGSDSTKSFLQPFHANDPTPSNAPSSLSTSTGFTHNFTPSVSSGGVIFSMSTDSGKWGGNAGGAPGAYTQSSNQDSNADTKK